MLDEIPIDFNDFYLPKERRTPACIRAICLQQTIPMLEAHLKMAQNLYHDDKMLGSRENAANNKD